MNSKQKGKRGELEACEFLRSFNVAARRGQQFKGGDDSPDIVADIPYHIEVKRTEKLQLWAACRQAEADCQGKEWIVLHKANGTDWIVIQPADSFLRLQCGKQKNQ